jgi:hypothetical protein
MPRGALLGDWEGKLSNLIVRAQSIASGEARKKLVERAAKVIGSQQKRQFRTSVGPDGNTWPKAKDALAARPLFRRGALLASAFAEVLAAGVRFGFSARHANPLQKGTSRREPRKLLPEGDRLGPVWGPRVQGSLRQMLGKILKGQATSASEGGGEA